MFNKLFNNIFLNIIEDREKKKEPIQLAIRLQVKKRNNFF